MVDRADNPTLPGLYAAVIRDTLIFILPAVLVAGLCTLGILNLRLPGNAIVPALAAALLAHGTFMGLFAGLATPAPTLGRRLAAGLRTLLWGALPLSAVLALAIASLFVHPMLAVVVWGVATWFALPARLGRRAWMTDPRVWRGSPVTPWRRLLLMAPSLAFLGAMTGLLFRPGVSWGLMDGGAVAFPLLGLTLFWACFGGAVLSASIAPRP